MSFLRRRLLTAALTANALRPLPGRAGALSFFPGWLTSELAPHLLGATALDAVVSVRRGRASGTGLAVAAASAAGLVVMIQQARRVGDVLEESLVEGLGGVDYIDQLDAAPTPAELATPWRQVARPFHFGEPGVRVEKNIAYSEFGRRGRLDIYLPDVEDLADAPVLLQVHGGGWTVGRKDQQGLPLMYRMAAKGWVCVAINYRLAPRHPFPAHIVDVKTAIAWIRKNIEAYGGDPAYLAITGGSAGGHLAALAAVTANDPAFQPGFEEADTSIQAAVPIYGVYDFCGADGLRSAVAMRDSFLAPVVLRARFDDDPTPFQQASPLFHVDADSPDFFVLHGTHDTLVDVRQARAFVRRLREVSRGRVVYAELPGAQHAFEIFHSIRGAHAVRAIDRFLTWSWNGHRQAGEAPTPTSSESA